MTVMSPSEIAAMPVPKTYARLEVPSTLGIGPAVFHDPEVQHFLQHGWLVIDDALDASIITHLRQALDDLAVRRPGQELIGNLLEEDDRFAILLEVPAVMTRLQAILGTCIQLHSGTARISGPGTPDQTWHRDGPWPVDPVGIPYGGIPAQINCGFYLDITPASGPFVCLPGSHRRVVAPPKGSGIHADELRLVPRPGQAVLFDGWMYHRGGANQSADERRACLMCYQHAWMKSRERFDGPRVQRLRATGTSRTRLMLGEIASW